MGIEATLEIGKDLLTLNEASRRIAKERFDQKDWSGLPIPVPGLSLVLERRYKHKCLENFRWKECYDENACARKFMTSQYRGQLSSDGSTLGGMRSFK